MDKKKKLTYLLVVIVAGVWGTIFFKIYQSYFGEDEPKKVEEVVVQNSPNYSFEKDTFSIIASYRDPFLGKVIRSKSNRSTHRSNRNSSNTGKKVVKNTESKVKEVSPIVWPKIAYKGMVNGANRVAIIEIDGKSHIIEQGETINSVNVKVCAIDSVIVQYRSQEKSYYKL